MKENKKIDELGLDKLREEYRNHIVPEEGIKRMKKSIENAKRDKRKYKFLRNIKNTGLGIAATFAFFVLLSNSSENVARAMERIPVIGKTVNVITFGRFDFNDENHHASVVTPQIKVEDDKYMTEGIKITNEKAKEYTSMLINKFDKDIETKGGKQGLDVSYDVVTDNENWFTLCINVSETEASGNQYSKYYNIDKRTGDIVELKDIFKKDTNYIDIITKDIKNQMNEQMNDNSSVSYFINNPVDNSANFESIKKDQNFYMDKNGKLVIVFDEYEVAPGSMGCPQFTINDKAIKDILK